MQGKTHLVVGTAAALALFDPGSPQLLIAGCGCAALGSVISDIDCAPSHAGRHAVKTIALCVMIVIAVFAADAYFKTGLYEKIVRAGGRGSRQAGLLVFLFLCAFGMLTSHRAFMHSLAGGAALTGCMYFMVPEAYPYFAAGFASHLVLDLLNRKGIRLFYPLSKKYCFGWFKANGLVDRLLFAAGVIALVLLVRRSALPFVGEYVREAKGALRSVF